MSPLTSPKLAAAALLTLVVVGCATQPPAAPPPPETTEGRVKQASIAQVRAGNQGRLLGTIVADDTVLSWAGVADLSGAKAQAFDQDGTPLSPPVSVDAEGHFMLEGLRDSRSRIFVEADVNGLRYRTLAPAPRSRKDYGVTLDAGTTFLADKMRRSALDKELLLDKIDADKIEQTEDLVNVYLDDDVRRDVLEQDDADLNAYAFDHFMDDNLPVKLAVYQISAAVLRGWKPNQPQTFAPTPKPTPTPKSTPTPTPTPEATPTPDPGPTPLPPK